MLKTKDVNSVKIPHYEELNVATIWSHYRHDDRLRHFMPDHISKGRQIDRTWFFNVFHTLAPEVVREIVDHAEKQRQEDNSEAGKLEKITITEEWRDKLREIPFKSSKY